MVTPFKQDLSVDYQRAEELAAYLIEQKSDGIVVCGTTGESPTLTENEKLELFRRIKEKVGDRAVIIAGTGNNNTSASISLTQKAEALGVDAILLVTPYYNKPTQEGLYQHFSQIAASTKLPVLLYNVPGRTGSNLLPHTVRQLAEIDNIIGIKEASGDLNQISEIARITPSDFVIYSGDDALTLPILAVGGCGVISVASHLVGPAIKKMLISFFEGKIETAIQIHKELLPVFKGLFITTNPIPVKMALRYKGMDMGGFRLPLTEPPEDIKEKIKSLVSCL